ncbi:MAG: 30S ribosomal protein S4 [Patescibacteria group bacterium]
MARGIDHKCKQCRREGEKLFLKGEKCFSGKCPIVKRNYPPGLHGVKGRSRQSNFGMQLREKQKAKRLYRLSERQFFNYFQKATKQQGETVENFLRLLELRLDNVIYRLGIGASRDQARQIVGHGFVLVNGRGVNIPSYQVKAGDVITIKETKQKRPAFQEALKKLEKHETPSWLSFDKPAVKATVTAVPTMPELKQNFQPQLIIEFYSR